MYRKKTYWNSTNRDLAILNILWDTGVPMTAVEIAEVRDDFSVNVVQPPLRKLLKENLIEVSDIIYSGKVLTRRFRPTMTREEFAASQVTEELQQTKADFSAPSFVMAILKSEKDDKKKLQEIQELEQMLEEYKKTL